MKTSILITTSETNIHPNKGEHVINKMYEHITKIASTLPKAELVFEHPEIRLKDNGTYAVSRRAKLTYEE